MSLPAASSPIAFVLLIVVIATTVERCAHPPGGLQLAPPEQEEAARAYRLGTTQYPRIARDADGFPVRIPGPCRRIVSQYWSIDEFLYAVENPQEVVAVSSTAYERDFSNVLPQVQQFKPAIAADPERVLRLNPDLVLVSSAARADFTSLVRSTGVPVFRLGTNFESLGEIEEAIRTIGYVTGSDQQAQRVVARFEDTIRSAALRSAAVRHASKTARPRVLGLGGSYSYGDHTLFDDICKTLGAVNVGAEGGLHGYSALEFEQVLRWDPDWIFVGADAGKAEQVLSQLERDPAIALTKAARTHRIRVLDNRIFLPMSPYTARLVEAMADALYPARASEDPA